MLNFFQLPYDNNAFKDLISSETIDIHYGKHHQTYFTNLKNLISGTEFEEMGLELIIKKSFSENKAIFNNSAQVFNHDFYWKSLSPEKKEISDFVLNEIKKDFGSLDNFKAELKDVSLKQFASGWSWIILDGDKIKIVSTSNAENPLLDDKKILLCIDLWEHAYYIDYRNRRADYLDIIIENFLNWDFFEENFFK